MIDRCEPPPELRGVDGWYWVCGRSGLSMPAHWYASPRDGIEPLWRNLFTQQTGTPAWAAAEWEWRYLAPVATPEEVAALRAEVARAGAACADMGAEIVRLRAEVASMRVTLGQQPPAEGAEPIGCPLPGMCSMVAATSTLRARVAELEAALEELIGPYTGGADSTLDDPYIMDRARAALEGKGHD